MLDKKQRMLKIAWEVALGAQNLVTAKSEEAQQSREELENVEEQLRLPRSNDKRTHHKT